MVNSYRNSKNYHLLVPEKFGVPTLSIRLLDKNPEGSVKAAAIYARVSSDRQKEEQTIASQTAALIEYSQQNDNAVPAEKLDALYRTGIFGNL
jgi:hypothetical protein